MPTITLTRDKHLVNITHSTKKDKIRYNLRDKIMEKWYIREKEWRSIKQQYEFFRGLSVTDIICEEEKFLQLISKVQDINPNCTSVSSFISRLDGALVYENYIAEGIRTECRWDNNSYYKRFLTKPLEWYSKDMINFFKKYNIKVTKQLEQTYQNNSSDIIQIVNILDKFIDKDDVIKTDFFNEIINNGLDSNYIELINQYNFDRKALISFSMNYLKPFESINYNEGFRLLRDYYRMAQSISRNVKKYPKYLKSMHDIILVNFNAFKKEYPEHLFKERIKESLEFEGKDFVVVNPKTSKDIITEGTSLGHCVGSYVDDMISGKTYIFFLRAKLSVETSLVTLEHKGNAIVQAKGSRNRDLTEKEQEFLKNYCKKQKMELTL